MYEMLFLMNVIQILENEAWLLDLTRISKYILKLILSLEITFDKKRLTLINT